MAVVSVFEPSYPKSNTNIAERNNAMKRIASKLFLPLCLLPIVAAAEDYSSWIQLMESDVYTPYSFDSAGKWNDSDGTAPSSTKNYYVPAGLLMKTSGGNATFGGGIIAVAGTVQVGNTGGTTVTWPEMRLLPGGIYKQNSNNSIGGKLVILGTEAEPAHINSFLYANRTFEYKCTFEGEPGSVVHIGHTSLSGATHESILGCMVKITGGKLDGFKGKIIVGGETHLNINTGRLIQGGVHVESTGILHSEQRTGTITVGDLSLANGSELLNEFNACASVRWDVTNSLTLAGSPTLRFSSFDVGPNNTNGVTVIRLFGPAAVNAPSTEAVAAMRVVARLGALPLPRNVHVELVDNGDGTKDIRVAYDGIAPCVRTTALMTWPPPRSKPATKATGQLASFPRRISWAMCTVPGFGSRRLTGTSTSTIPAWKCTQGVVSTYMSRK